MNTPLLNREFQMSSDGWYQIAPLGEFPHGQTGLVQVVDPEACDAMVNAFRMASGVAPVDAVVADRFAGLLVDFDHFSLDTDKRSEAAGWITALEARGGQRSEVGNRRSDGGLWAKIRWSDLGEQAVKGGRYRFISPVWTRADCTDLGGGRVRPTRLLNAAVTNDPNLKGMVPLCNSVTASGGEKRFKWTLGISPEDRHCPSCSAAAGQVHTMSDWTAAGVLPGVGTICGANCHCSLVETGDAVAGKIGNAAVRKVETVKSEQLAVNSGRKSEVIENAGWTDAARAASLAVRRARALTRARSGVSNRAAASETPVVPAAGGVPPGGAADAGGGGGGQPAAPMEQFQREGVVAMDDQDIQTLYGEIAAKQKVKQPLDAIESAFQKATLDEGLRRAIARKRAQTAAETQKSNP